MALALWSGAAKAQSPQESAALSLPAPSVVVLDRERLYTQSHLGQAIEAALMAQDDALEAENAQIKAALEAEERKLTQARLTMKGEDFRALAAAFDQKAEKARLSQLEKKRALEEQSAAERSRFMVLVRPVLTQLVSELQVSAILNPDAVLFGLDITDLAIARLNTQESSPASEAP